MQALTLAISGMSCGHCLNAVSKALSQLAGVKVGSVQMGRAELEFDPALTNPAGIVAALEGAGYVAAAD